MKLLLSGVNVGRILLWILLSLLPARVNVGRIFFFLMGDLFESVVLFYKTFLERHFRVRRARRATGIWVPYQPLWEEPGSLEVWVGTDGYLVGRRSETEGPIIKLESKTVVVPEAPAVKRREKIDVAGAEVVFQAFENTVAELSSWLTLGCMSISLDSPRFWDPVCICDTTFENGSLRTSWRELRIFKDSHLAAFHPSLAPTVVFEELARMGKRKSSGGAVLLPRQHKDLFVDRLSTLRESIDCLRNMLATNAEGLEAVFAKFLFDNSNLLCPSASRTWRETPLLGSSGEVSCVPDIVFQESGGSFLFVEVERPSDKMETRNGRPGHKATDGAYQLSQWKTLISRNPSAQVHYPGVSVDICRFLLVVGRGSPSLQSRGTIAFELRTFDEVVEAAEHMFRNLSSGGAPAV